MFGGFGNYGLDVRVPRTVTIKCKAKVFMGFHFSDRSVIHI